MRGVNSGVGDDRNVDDVRPSISTSLRLTRLEALAARPQLQPPIERAGLILRRASQKIFVLMAARGALTQIGVQSGDVRRGNMHRGLVLVPQGFRGAGRYGHCGRSGHIFRLATVQHGQTASRHGGAVGRDRQATGRAAG